MKELISLLKKGKTIVYPTDTAYALGGDFLSPKVRSKIYKLKKRSKDKNLPIIASSLSMVKKYFLVNKQEELLAKKNWPGAFSLVLRVRPKHIKILGQTVAVRIPDQEIAIKLCKGLNKPIISTSANISGKETCYNIENVIKQFEKSGQKLEIVLDYGKLPQKPVSKIVQVMDGEVMVIR
jgi:L-threonylcarbamoyladenylate synthase